MLSLAGSAYRVVEFGQGFDGYLASHEVFFYVLEALPMLPPFVLFNIWHPRRLAEAETIEALGAITAEQEVTLEERPKVAGR
jgi:hypothetical protein